MSIQAVGMRAYSEAVQNVKGSVALAAGYSAGSTTQFAKTLDQSRLRDSVDPWRKALARRPILSNTPPRPIRL